MKSHMQWGSNSGVVIAQAVQIFHKHHIPLQFQYPFDFTYLYMWMILFKIMSLQ